MATSRKPPVHAAGGLFAASARTAKSRPLPDPVPTPSPPRPEVSQTTPSPVPTPIRGDGVGRGDRGTGPRSPRFSPNLPVSCCADLLERPGRSAWSTRFSSAAGGASRSSRGRSCWRAMSRTRTPAHPANRPVGAVHRFPHTTELPEAHHSPAARGRSGDSSSVTAWVVERRGWSTRARTGARPMPCSGETIIALLAEGRDIRTRSARSMPASSTITVDRRPALAGISCRCRGGDGQTYRVALARILPRIGDKPLRGDRRRGGD